MAFSKEEIEYYHNNGLMPDWIYYQQNGKTAQENYADIMRKRQAYFKQLMEARSRRAREAQEQKKLEAELEKKAYEVAEKAIEDIFKDFL